MAKNNQNLLKLFPGHLEVATLLIRNGAELNLTDKNSQGALHLACFYGKEEMTSLLVHSGCDPDLQDSQGQRPIDVAMQMGNTDIAQTLRKHHKVPSIHHSEVKVNMREEKPVKPPAKGAKAKSTGEGRPGRGPSQKSKSSRSSSDGASVVVDQTDGEDTERRHSLEKKRKKGKYRHYIDGKVIKSDRKEAKSEKKRESLDIDERPRKCMCCVIS